MIECYYKECIYHYKDEPFCSQDKCKATNDQLIILSKLREKYLQENTKNEM